MSIFDYFDPIDSQIDPVSNCEEMEKMIESEKEEGK